MSLLSTGAHAMFGCTILWWRVMYHEFPSSSSFILMSNHFFREEFSPSVTAHGLDSIASLGLNVGLIMFVGFEGLTLLLQKIQLCFTGCAIYTDSSIQVTVNALDRSGSPTVPAQL